ncbi:hypothetical protein [Streptomyces sp. NPDC055006]
MGDYKMTGDFAGAMVTVIPVIMLMAVAEANKYAKSVLRAVNAMLDYLTDEAVEEPPKPISAWHWPLTLAWLTLGMLHVVAEVKLIVWLAKTEHPAAPNQALFITIVASLGFLVVVMGPFFAMSVGVLRKLIPAMNMYYRMIKHPEEYLRSASTPADEASDPDNQTA